MSEKVTLPPEAKLVLKYGDTTVDVELPSDHPFGIQQDDGDTLWYSREQLTQLQEQVAEAAAWYDGMVGG